MTLTIQLPSEYGYVVAAAAASLFINTYHFVLSSSSRRAAGLAYPIPYASPEQAAADPRAFTFNCAQRAHANFVENYAPFLGGLAVAGLRFPAASAAAGAAWVLGRVLYAEGYVRRGPPGRGLGFIVSSLADLVLKGLAVTTGVQMIMEA